jgi:hypothetical protein
VGENENPFVLYYLDRRAWRFWFNWWAALNNARRMDLAVLSIL